MDKRVDNNKLIKVVMGLISVIIIAVYAYSITPKIFQNDTFYTIKIGEHIQNSVEKVTDILPWNKGLDMKDPFSIHKDLPYTYPHWLYDWLTYRVYCIDGFNSVYIATCLLSIVLGLSIYFINRRINKSIVISAIITLASMYCLRNFIAARAQLVTFILFVFTIYGIEFFIKTKKIRYVALLIIIPILIANLHTAVWPFYFILYLPYLAEYLIVSLSTKKYSIILKKLKLKLMRKKLSKEEYEEKAKALGELTYNHNKKIEEHKQNTYKIDIEKNKNIRWLFIVILVCALTGFCTPIKDTPYTYLLKTEQGNSTQNISEHLPLTLIDNVDAMATLCIIIGILTFTKTKIKLRDFFMLAGLILLSFMTQRQVSMLVLIGNFILVRLICQSIQNLKNKYTSKFNTLYISLAVLVMITVLFNSIALKNTVKKRNDQFIDESSYPVAASDYIINNLIPDVGIENLRLYNEYNYGSYLLFRGIPVFIDSRCDLYTPEFNGKKNSNGKYDGNDIFSDFLDISSLTSDYNTEFNKYDITHVITYSDSKLHSALKKDQNYELLYSDEYFVIYKIINT